MSSAFGLRSAMEMIFSSVIFFIFTLPVIFGADEHPVVLTSTGPVRGVSVPVKDSTVDAFLGVPYAEPPVGDQRFRKPVPIKPWSEVYNATKKPPYCVQNAKQKFYWMPQSDNMAEDCLFLNVWVPTTKTKKLRAIMIWIHGGAFNIGSSEMEAYDGANLAAHGDVIVASLNYRIGFLGFLTALIPDANGNMGIYDQIVAIRWLKANVKVFGGDPDLITLIGESAGAISIAMHLVSPLTKNLFKRVIMESGAGIHPIAFEATKSQLKTSNKLAILVGCANKKLNMTTNPQLVVNCLKQVPAETISDAESAMMKSNPITVFPRWGEDYIPFEMTQMIREYHYQKTEVLIGTNKDEGSFFLAAALPDYFGTYGQNGIPSVSKRLAHSLITTMFRFTEQKEPEKIADFYINNANSTNTESMRRAIFQAIGDYMITCNSLFFADYYSRTNDNVYFYIFSQRPSDTLMADWVGATHYDEVQYVFGQPLVNGHNFSREDEIVSDRVMDRWISFAKTGNPNIPDGVHWPSYSYRNPRYLDIGIKEEVKSRPDERRCEFWRQRFQSEVELPNEIESLVQTQNLSCKLNSTSWIFVLVLLWHKWASYCCS